jgi:hypothetical protein
MKEEGRSNAYFVQLGSRRCEAGLLARMGNSVSHFFLSNRASHIGCESTLTSCWCSVVYIAQAREADGTPRLSCSSLVTSVMARRPLAPSLVSSDGSRTSNPDLVPPKLPSRDRKSCVPSLLAISNRTHLHLTCPPGNTPSPTFSYHSALDLAIPLLIVASITLSISSLTNSSKCIKSPAHSRPLSASRHR